MFNLKIPGILRKDTKSFWVYKVSIREAGIYFDTDSFKYGKRAARRFQNEYNDLFNKNEISKAISKNFDLFRLQSKIDELKAIYYSLIYADGENARERFKILFGKEFEYTENDINRINDKAKFYIDKINALPKPKEEKGITFNELIAIVENSRGITIDREMKVFEFHKIYELELKKWQTSTK